MSPTHRELERTYDADGGPGPEVVGAALGDVDAGLGIVAGPSRRLDATYYDTTDLRLARAGLTLRRRTGGEDDGWHLKVPDRSGGRHEVRLALGRSVKTVPAELRRLVWIRTRDAPLVPVARLVTDRRTHQILDPDGGVLAEVADDAVEAVRYEHAAGREDVHDAWREIEVELVGGGTTFLESLDKAVRERGLVPATSQSKVGRVLGVDMTQGAARDAATFGPASAAGEVIVHYLAHQVEQIRKHDPLARIDADDGVHKIRVAARRLRNVLKAYKTMFERVVVRPLRDELRWLIAELGNVRDIDVVGGRLLSALHDEDPELLMVDVTAAVEADLASTREVAHRALVSSLDSTRYRDLVQALEAFVAEPPYADRALLPAGEAIPSRIAKSYDAVRYRAERARGTEPGDVRDRRLHDLRKAVKRSRYAAEAARPSFGKQAKSYARAMRALQDELGVHHDSVVQRERLWELVQGADEGTAFTFGRLHASEEETAHRIEARFDSWWSAASHENLRRWFG